MNNMCESFLNILELSAIGNVFSGMELNQSFSYLG